MKWAIAGLVVLAGLFGGAVWYGWQTIETLRSEIEALNDADTELRQAQDDNASRIAERVVAQMAADNETDAVKRMVERLRADIGTDTRYTNKSVCEAVNELDTPDFTISPMESALDNVESCLASLVDIVNGLGSLLASECVLVPRF